MHTFVIARNDVAMSGRASKRNRALAAFAIAALFLCCLTSCVLLEDDTHVSIDGKFPPTFKLTGSGHQISFSVEEIPADNRLSAPYQDPRKDIRQWEIIPNKGTSDEVWLWPSITYGSLPPGFTQKFPLDGKAPSPLVEGKVYSAGGEAYNANGGEIWFSIRDSKSIEVQRPQAH